MAVERQSSALPPAQPSYILRGHSSQIHSVRFVRQNSRLLTGDANGWVVYWKLETKRALAIRSSRDETTLSTVLPTEDPTTQRPKPWLLHTLPCNTLNFAAFSLCYEHQLPDAYTDVAGSAKLLTQSSESILVATPSTDDTKINVYQFPEEKLKYVVPMVPATDTGMVMAVKLVYHPDSKSTLILAGYEGGLTSVHQLPSGTSSSVRHARLVYISRPHTQPILSLDMSPDCRTYFTSSADAIIATHRVPEITPAVAFPEGVSPSSRKEEPTLEAKSKTSIPVEELATISPADASDPPLSSIHNLEEGAGPLTTPIDSSLSFAKQAVPTNQSTSAGLSSLLSSAPPQPKIRPQLPPLPAITLQQPYKISNTKHAGQQSLSVRSDGRIIATGGWDSRIRIYSAKTLQEIAVLKWHKEGVYAVDFAQILEAGDLVQGEAAAMDVAKKETGLGKLQRQREEQMQLKHWVVAGAKDGKVSLWEVF
ncbi:WD40 repeat-like protein [Ophiobolus disseminans]|uniref:ASTRA-associated protein 1 n=1 Tax=Ophiobolus disseminans TaxID=1469910 RepID=A0A6A7A8W7_9PLEO|nr:WD40 repeat-like protein [Ophiobolus disseminans]